MPCKGTNAKGGPCKRPTKGEYCLSHCQNGGHASQDGGRVKGLPMHKDYDPKKAPTWVKAVKAIAKFVRPVVNRVSAPVKGVQTHASDRLEKFLDDQKDKTVVKLQLGRKPINSKVKKALDLMSLGKFSKKVKELNYSDAYHQFLLVTLSDGKTYKLEKNEKVEHAPVTKSDYDGEVFEVPLKGKQLNLAQMVETAEEGNEEHFWKYRAGSDNCQRFTRDIVEKNGLLPEDEEGQKQFELQDAKKMTDTLPPLVANAVTDVANVAGRIWHGDGAKQNMPVLQKQHRYLQQML